MSEDQERFLSRWSRRKIEAREGAGEHECDSKSATSPAARTASGAGESADSSAPLPSIEELRGLASEYREFLRPEVDESLRRAALKKLFQDPHFNIMDGLDTYIDDYTKADPIPEAMLKALNQAQGLLFDREDERGADEAAVAVDAADQPPTVTEDLAREVSKLSSAEANEDGNGSQPGPGKPSPAT